MSAIPCPNCQALQEPDAEGYMPPHKIPGNPYLTCAASGYAHFTPAPLMGQRLQGYVVGLDYDVRWLPAGYMGPMKLWTENRWLLQINQPAIFSGELCWEHLKGGEAETGWVPGLLTCRHRGGITRKPQAVRSDAQFRAELAKALAWLWEKDRDAVERQDMSIVRRGSTLSSWPDTDIFGDEHDPDPDEVAVAKKKPRATKPPKRGRKR